MSANGTAQLWPAPPPPALCVLPRLLPLGLSCPPGPWPHMSPVEHADTVPFQNANQAPHPIPTSAPYSSPACPTRTTGPIRRQHTWPAGRGAAKASTPVRPPPHTLPPLTPHPAHARRTASHPSLQSSQTHGVARRVEGPCAAADRRRCAPVHVLRGGAACGVRGVPNGAGRLRQEGGRRAAEQEQAQQRVWLPSQVRCLLRDGRKRGRRVPGWGMGRWR